jgi:hypothetical protein
MIFTFIIFLISFAPLIILINQATLRFVAPIIMLTLGLAKFFTFPTPIVQFIAQIFPFLIALFPYPIKLFTAHL